MAPRLQIAAAAGPLAGRPIRLLVCDEIDKYPALAEADPIILAPLWRAIRARSFAMRLREKGKKDGPVITMGWDEAQAALQAGTHEVADADGSGTEKPSEDDAPDDGLDAKTKAELETLAKERGVDISAAKTKADIVEALRKA